MNFGDFFSNPFNLWLLLAFGLATASVVLVFVALFMILRIRRQSKPENLHR